MNKQFQIWEKHRLQFRMEFFNLFNHPIFRFPSALNIGTPSTFTRITETAIPARLMQFGMGTASKESLDCDLGKISLPKKADHLGEQNVFWFVAERAISRPFKPGTEA